MEYQIKWEIFTPEEQGALKKAIELRLSDFLTQCVVEFTPEKELEIQKLKNEMNPVAAEFESGVLKQFTKEKMDKIKKGEARDTSPESPEEEAALQKLLDEEQLARQREFAGKLKEQAETLETMAEPVKKVVWKKKESTN